MPSIINRALATACSALIATALALPAAALDAVSFGTNWVAQAEHGGFYQAVADGTYAKYGLKVTIRPGGPTAPNRQLLHSGRLDFFMGGNLLEVLLAHEQGSPTVVVAAMFQKEPQILMAHPNQGIEKFGDLAKLKTIYLARDLYNSAFKWMMNAYPGFRNEQYKAFVYDPAPFIGDPRSGQQGYVTADPYTVEKLGGFKPKVFLLADHGYDTYSTNIETRPEVLRDRPEVVRRFVEASILGWYNYLNGDNRAANELIKRDNPDMTDEMISLAIQAMKEYGIVISGDAETKGIGCITGERINRFYKAMTDAKVLKPGLDVTKTYDARFVCKGLGVKR